jgi:putative FmdB family regulatory protein
MPLYVYSCGECEIELEERRPAWRAEEPVECPICHRLCTRELSTFATRRREQEPPTFPLLWRTTPTRHSLDCECCGPSRRRV